MAYWLTVSAWVELLYIDLVGVFGFRALQRIVSRTELRATSAPPDTIAAVAHALDHACALYFKSALCLQRSAAVTRLLRRRGLPATLVIGCHLAPMRSHAWVEIGGEVVSDNVDGLEHYKILDRW